MQWIRRIFGMHQNSDTFLCYVAATNFDAVIDDTQQLSVRRGASIFMREVIQELPEWFKKGEGFSCDPISTGASIGIYVVKAASKTELEGRLLKLLREGPPSGYQSDGDEAMDFSAVRFFTFSVAVRKVDEPNLRELSPRLVEELAAEAAVRQMRGLSLSLEEVGPGAGLPNRKHYACQWDGVRPATETLERKEDSGWEPYALSPSVLARYYGGRRHHGREDDHHTLSELKKNFILHETGGKCDHLYVFDLEQLTDFDPREVSEQPTDFDSRKNPYKNFSGLSGKMAVIHIDGNGFGRIKAGLKSMGEYQEFDEFLQEKRRQFLIDLFDNWAKVTSFLNHIEGTDRCRFELLQWGGDEMLFIVPAWLGFPILHLFFQNEYDWDDKILTHSAGMVLCSRKTPIARAQQLAGELTDWCKRHSRQENLYATLILESIDYPTQPLEQFFRQRFGVMAEYLFPASPYSGNWFELMEQVAKLKEGLPRSRIYAELLSLLERLEQAGECVSLEQLRDDLNESADRLQEVVDRDERDEALRGAFDAWCNAWPERDHEWLANTRLPEGRRNPPREVLEAAQRIWCWIHLLEQWDYLLTGKELGVKEESPHGQ